MGNRWKNKKTFAAACAFVGLCLGASCIFLPAPAHAVLFNSITSAQADDYLVSSGFTAWQASNGPVKAMPLIAGQEVVSGAEGWNVLSNGNSSFQSESVLDTRDIIQYQSIKKIGFKGLGTISDTGAMTGMTAPINTESQCYNGFNVTATNEKGSQSATVIGRNIGFDSAISITQLDSEIPDTLDVTQQAAGNGFATIAFNGQSLTGFEQSLQPAWQNDVSSKITGAGSAFSVGKKTTWRSFANIFNSSFEVTA